MNIFHKIDNRPGKELGLTGPYADVPVFQIVNDAHDLFFSLTSRLITLEYGPDQHAVKSWPQWPIIDARKTEFACQLNSLGGDAVKAARLSEKIRGLTETVADLVAAAQVSGGNE